MRCASCGDSNPEAARFCGSCGGSLAPDVRCADCGHANPPEQPFCHGCGSALGPAPATFGSGRYAALGEIGRGGSKAAYLARDLRLDRQVVIAVIETDALDLGDREGTEREVRAMARLGDHPNVVTIHDVIEEPGRICLVTEWMQGGDLAAILRESPTGRLPVEQAVRVARDVARGLAHAHARGVIHRDVKPANVYLGAEGAGRLGDFGLAAPAEVNDANPLEDAGRIVGTIAYLPPEQARGEPPRPQSDLYALGATLYHALVGEPPFVGADAVSVVTQHLNVKPARPSERNLDVPPALDELVVALLAKRPEDRPATAIAVAQELEQIRSVCADGDGASGIATDWVGATRGHGPLVGREHEMRALRAELSAALAGRTRVVTLAGDAGMGKTRLLEELSDIAVTHGARVLWGSCHESGAQPPYWPWTQALRSLLADCSAAQLQSDVGLFGGELLGLIPELGARLPELRAPPEHGIESRMRRFDGMARWLRSASRERPILLVLDDLHWADPDSLELLRFVARAERSAALLVACSFRPGELDEGDQRRRALEGEQAVGDVRLVLDALNDEEISRFCFTRSRAIPSPSQASALRRATEGNPLLLREALALIDLQGGVREHRLFFSEIDLAGTVDFMERRVASLSVPCRELLECAAVIGRVFPVDLLAELTGRAPRALRERLAEAEGTGVIEHAGPDAERFHHVLIWDALYRGLSDERRRALHSRVALALERAGSEELEGWTELARHATQALPDFPAERASLHAERAAAAALRVNAFAQGAGLYDAALRALEEHGAADGARLAELETARAICTARAGRTLESEALFEQAASRARAAGRGDLIAECAVEQSAASFMFGGAERAETVALLREASELPELPRRRRVPVLAALVRVLAMRAELEEALACLASLETFAREDDAIDLQVEMMRARMHCASLRGWLPDGAPGFMEEILADADRLENVSRERQDLAGISSAEGWRLTAHLMCGNVEGIERSIRALDALAERSHVAFHAWKATVHNSVWAAARGEFDRAEKLAMRALQSAYEAAVPSALAPFGLIMQTMRRLQGRPHELLGAVREVVLGDPDGPGTATGRAMLAASLADLGRRDEALEQIEHLARDQFASLRRNVAALPGIAFVVDTLCTLGDASHAPTLYELLARRAGLFVIVGSGLNFQGAVDLYLALLARQIGRLAQAEEHFLEAERLHAQLGAAPYLARTRAEYASLCAARGARGDAERAIELANQALRVADELGLPPVAECALRAKLEAQGVDLWDSNQSIHAVASSVGRRSDVLPPQVSGDGAITLLFSDLESFTRLVGDLGDEQAHRIVRMHNAIVREALSGHDGYEVEVQGDGFLLAFPDPVAGVRCALAIQHELASHAERHPDTPLRPRMGLHVGPVVRDADKFFGSTVIRAYRISDQARGGEILVSRRLAELLRSRTDLELGGARPCQLKGFDDVEELHSVHWAGAPSESSPQA